MHSIRLPSRKYLFLCREYEFLFHYTLVDIFLIWVNIISDYGIYFLISISVINMVRHFYGFIGSFFFFLRGLYSRIAPIFLKIGDVCLAFLLCILIILTQELSFYFVLCFLSFLCISVIYLMNEF